MQQNLALERLYAEVKARLLGAEAAHGWEHARRVYDAALAIAQAEGYEGNRFVLGAAALLHDLADHKFVPERQERKRIILEFLQEYGLEKGLTEEIFLATEGVSFSQNKGETAEPGALLRILRDADRLDAMGAMGIARTFAYGGRVDRPLLAEGGEQGSVEHFFEKLLLLKDGLYTEAAKALAAERHAFLLEFLRHFFIEYYGEEEGLRLLDERLTKIAQI
ncbi:MAG: HD domain-containing protein [Christensenellaceae bacterium]|jgi:uncharacterized protein|nr:HD domain-containing protein [Christensenellaceae bacterium]